MSSKQRRIALTFTAGLFAMGLLAGCGAATPDSATPDSAVTESTSTPASDPTPTTTPIAESSIEAFCEEAGRLAVRDPQAAIDLIDAFRAPAKEAAARGDDPAVENQDELLNACTEVRVSAAEQLALNAVLASEKEQRAAEEKAAKEDAKEKEEEANKTASERVAEDWDRVAEHWILPLSGVAIVTASIFVGLLIVSRIVSISPIARKGIWKTGKRRAALVFGLLLMLASSLIVASHLVRLAKSPVIEMSIRVWLGVALGAALVGVFLFARWLASRLRLAVDVYGITKDKDDWATSRVVNLLSSMAGTPARGIEVPVGSDVDALAGPALPTTITNKVLSVFQEVVKFLFGGVPWQVSVRTDGKKLGTVTVSHNGVTVDKTLIDVTPFELPAKVDTSEALYYFAATVVIMALRKRNPGFEGLSGTTRWQSLGLQALATASFKFGDPELEAMLEDAVENDVGNHLAIFALENTRSRTKVTLPELQQYTARLQEQLVAIKKLPKVGDRALDVELRVRLVLALVTLNIKSLTTAAEWSLTPQQEANIVELVLQLNKRDPESGFYEDMKAQAAIAFEDLVPPEVVVSNGSQS